jgi:uncharacterized protein (TIGR03083 family)
MAGTSRPTAGTSPQTETPQRAGFHLFDTHTQPARRSADTARIAVARHRCGTRVSATVHHLAVSDEQEAYAAVHGRLRSLLDGRAGDEPVIACPAWSVRDVVGHLAGLCEDWVRGELDEYATEAWTARQVERFSGASLEARLDAWASALELFTRLPAHPVMGPPARWAFGDAVVHEADIRGAIGSQRMPVDAVALALKGQIARWRQLVAEAHLPTLLLRCPDLREWWLGDHGDPAAVVLEVPAYEIFRGLSGRRSYEQLRSWKWSEDPTQFLSAGLPYPFTFATEAITE